MCVFVTNYFAEDLSKNLRRAERLFVFVEDVKDVNEEESEAEATEEGKTVQKKKKTEILSSEQKKICAEREMKKMRRKIRQKMKRWVRFYWDGGKYFEVGRVVGDRQGWTEGAYEGGQVPALCEAAERARPRRSQLIQDRIAGAEAGRVKGAGKGKGKAVFKPKKGGVGRGNGKAV